MKKILILIIFVLVTNIAISKVSGIYHIYVPIEPTTECFLEMYEDGMYQITLSDHKCIDLEYDLRISFGNYKINNNNLYLYDNYNKYKIEYVIKKGQLYPINTFKMLTDRPFSKYEHQSMTYTKYEIPNVIPLNRSRSKFSTNHKALSKLYYVVYGEVNGLNLDIKSNGKYKLSYKKIVITEGNWKRKNNELICNDSDLKHNFYLSIGEKSIVNRFFPFENRDCTLFIDK